MLNVVFSNSINKVSLEHVGQQESFCSLSCKIRIHFPRDPVYTTRSGLNLRHESVCDVQLKFNLTLDVQDWEEDVFPGPSKNNTIKSSTKLFLFHRLKSKKQKNPKSSPKDQHEKCTEHSAPKLEAPGSPQVLLNALNVFPTHSVRITF